MDLTVVTYNVHSCVGLDRVLAPERIAEVIAACDADVVALQEIDVGRLRSGHVNQHAVIAAQVQMQSHFYAALRYQDEEYGGALLSDLPMRLVKSGALPSFERLEPRGALWAEIEAQDKKVQILTTHLGLRPFERTAQIKALLSPDWLAHEECTGPMILCGDFNITPLSPLHRQLTRRLKSVRQRVGRPYGFGTFMGVLALDYIFVSDDIEVVSVEVPRNKLAQVASDHRPLIARLRVP